MEVVFHEIEDYKAQLFGGENFEVDVDHLANETCWAAPFKAPAKMFHIHKW